MNNDNPSEMSNSDLEKDMQQNNDENSTFVNQENVSKSTAAEGTLISSSEEPSSAIARDTTYSSDKEQDLDDLIHRQSEEKHNGTMPNPEEVSNWEDRQIDTDKITG